MSPSEFQNLQQSVEEVFAALYLIDVVHLSTEERKHHQQALAAAYLALVNTENVRYIELTKQMKSELSELTEQVAAMRNGVSGLVTPAEKLGVIATGLDALARLAQTLQIP